MKMKIELSWERQWFALVATGDLFPLGDHGDFETAEQSAKNLGLEVVWLADAETVTRWQEEIDFTKKWGPRWLLHKAQARMKGVQQ